MNTEELIAPIQPVYYTDAFKKEVCEYYSNHSGTVTCKKFGINTNTLWNWRVKLGYTSKSRISARHPSTTESLAETFKASTPQPQHSAQIHAAQFHINHCPHCGFDLEALQMAMTAVNQEIH